MKNYTSLKNTFLEAFNVLTDAYHSLGEDPDNVDLHRSLKDLRRKYNIAKAAYHSARRKARLDVFK